MKYITYYRVSTRTQANSGLGLEAQREAVKNYLANRPHEIVGEFTEVESGRKSKRPELAEALNACKKHKACLLVARTDRLSRNVHFLSGLMEQKVEFCAVDNPHATNLTLHIFAAVAEEESRLISVRTKAALAACRARGIELGKHGKILAKQNKVEADTFAKSLVKAIKSAIKKQWAEQGRVSHRGIADIFNAKKIKTARNGKWHNTTVRNLCNRVGIDITAA